MTRALSIARAFLYAAFAIAAAFAPNIPRAIALLHPTHPSAAFPTMVDSAAASLGWLSSAVADLFAHAGFAGLAFATALTVTATFALVELRARRGAPPVFAFAAAALCAACSLDAAHVGGGASDGLFFAALLLAVERDGVSGIVATAVVTLLWSNASPAGILAPLFASAYAIGAYVEMRSVPSGEPRDTRSFSHAGVLALVSLAATCATPALLAYPLDAWQALSLDSGLNDVLPAVPADAAPLAYRFGVVLTMVVAFAIGARSARVGATCAFVVAAILSFAKGTFVPFVAIAGAPILAEAATTIFMRARTSERAQSASESRPPFEVAAVCLIAAFACGLVAARRTPTIAAAVDVAPFGALAKYAADAKPHRRLACTKLGWCDVAERRYGLDVLADTRIANADAAVVTDQRAISGAGKDWVSKVRSRDVDAIFLDGRSGLATILVSRGWQRFARDGTAVLLLRGAGSP